jgi:hypothetical protein
VRIDILDILELLDEVAGDVAELLLAMPERWSRLRLRTTRGDRCSRRRSWWLGDQERVEQAAPSSAAPSCDGDGPVGVSLDSGRIAAGLWSPDPARR